MATSVLPAVIDALVTLSTTALPEHLVLDGVGVTESPADYLMIGVEDPDIEGAAFSADIRQERIAMAGMRQEVGTVTCCALSWVGDSGSAGQKAARDAAFATVAAVETIVRTTAPALDVSGVLKTEFGDRLTMSQAQDKGGSSCMVIFAVAYLAQI